MLRRNGPLTEPRPCVMLSRLPSLVAHMQFSQLKRRDFITLLGSAAMAWPVAAHAQQGKRPTIGYLGATTTEGERARTEAFVHRLRELGWIEGHTLAIQYRWAESRSERFPEFAAELVRLRVDIIAVASTAAALACKEATAVIPIVFPLTG